MSETSRVAVRYLALVEAIAARVALPRVAQVWLPRSREVPDKSAEFGVVALEDGSVGLVYVLLDDTLARLAEGGVERFRGANPAGLASGFAEPDPVVRSLGLGAINAIGQHLIRRAGLELDTSGGSIGGLDPQPGDHLGMVGFFPPLVRKLRERDVRLTVVELKKELVQREGRFQVTLDPAALRQCNQILCTSTLLLNDSLDRMLSYCDHADRVAVIGPSAGFLPDPLFERGVHTVGGNQVVDTEVFLARCAAEQKWGDASRKYTIGREGYPGFEAVLTAAEAR